MSGWTKPWLAWLLVLSVAPGLWAQTDDGRVRKSRAQLEKRQRQLQQDVQLTRKLLDEAATGQKKTLVQVKLLNQQIELRQRLLTTLEQELEVLTEEMNATEAVLKAQSNDAAQLKQQYVQVARAYQRSSLQLNEWLWVLSSGSLAQAYQRMMFFREFGRYRTSQLKLIRRSVAYLGQRRAQLADQQKAKARLLDARSTEQSRLASSRQQHQRLYSSLKNQEKAYQQRLQEYTRELGVIGKEITRLINAEAARARKRSTAGGGKKTETETRLSGQFSRNQGRLPWPTVSSRGVVTGYYGRQRDATGAVVQNDGIYIATPRGEKARAVFGGTVTRVLSSPILGTFIIIEHGEFRSVYVNLEGVGVKEGQEVQPLQELGTISTNERTGATELHFRIYKAFETMNPLAWLAPR